ncbi:hypothetical protein, partial [uncultured Stenotrophomonas sp.]|uniref:hypothetical protein n=1 Tax=uncultured Stenotrophomonas sp. TaxID=165438 RepID=UPI0025E4AD2D
MSSSKLLLRTAHDERYLRAHRDRAYRDQADWNVTKANDDRLHADDCRITAERLHILNFRLTNGGFQPTAQPLMGGGGWSINGKTVALVGRIGFAGDAVNPSMGGW